jgi:hypothetical protein
MKRFNRTHRVLLLTVFISTFLAFVSGSQKAVYPTKADKEGKCLCAGDSSGQQKIIVPAYFDPSSSSYWTDMNNLNQQTQTTKVGIAIMNPASGPGEVKRDEYVKAIKKATEAKIEIYGYVSTVYGDRPLDAVEKDINKYRSFYGVSNIFLDQVSSSLHKDKKKPDNIRINYYREVAKYIRTASSASVILNPGLFPAKEYMEVGDIVVVFENSLKRYENKSGKETDGFKLPDWNVCDFAPQKFAHLIYDAQGKSSMMEAMRLSKTRHVGYVYITDDLISKPPEDDPWNKLSSYLSSEAEQLSTNCDASP